MEKFSSDFFFAFDFVTNQQQHVAWSKHTNKQESSLNSLDYRNWENIEQFDASLNIKQAFIANKQRGSTLRVIPAHSGKTNITFTCSAS